MTPSIPLFLAAAAFAAFMLKADSLLASGKPGRSGGWRKGRGNAGAGKGSRKDAGAAGAAPGPPEGAPPSPAARGRGPSGPPGADGQGRAMPAARKTAAGIGAEGDGRGAARKHGGAGRGVEAGKGGRRAGRDGSGFAMEEDHGGRGFGMENDDGRCFVIEVAHVGRGFGTEQDDGNRHNIWETSNANGFLHELSLPDFPDDLAWGLETDSPVLQAFLDNADVSKKEPESGPAGEAGAWDMLGSAAYATLGPDDPFCWAAMSRAAYAAAFMPGCLAASAALASGAADGLCRAAVDAAGRPGAPRDTLPREAKFALDVLAASRGRLGLKPAWGPFGPFPAPAFRLSDALSPGVAPRPGGGPGPGELLSALETAEDGHGPGSREALAALSRLGAAVADEEARTGRPWPGWDAWNARAAGKSGEPAEPGEAGKSGNPGKAGGSPAEALLRAASACLDALLGRTHPDSLDALERLARLLAGGSGPGLPLDPLPCELPAEGALRDALDMFLETAWARAAASPGAPAASGGSAPESGAAPRTPELLERLPALLRLSGDRAAFAAAASAAECDALIPGFPGERSASLAEAGRAADVILGPSHPTSVRFRTYDAAILEARKKADEARDILTDAVFGLESVLGASARETTRAVFRLARNLHDGSKLMPAVARYSDAVKSMETPELAGPAALPFRRKAAAPGLPPGPAGRDRLAARIRLAQCLVSVTDDLAALDALDPFLRELRHVPPALGRPGSWPWPAELAGYALCMTGEAHVMLSSPEFAVQFLRPAVALVGPDPSDRPLACSALASLAGILGRRGDADSLREAAALAERESELRACGAGADSSAAAERLEFAAKCLETAGDTASALELRRKALDMMAR